MGLNSAIAVVENYLKWRKGEIETKTYSFAEISMALDVVIEAAKGLLIMEIMEQMKNLQAQKND